MHPEISRDVLDVRHWAQDVFVIRRIQRSVRPENVSSRHVLPAGIGAQGRNPDSWTIFAPIHKEFSFE
jgi:hypothetical protein